MTAHRRSLCRLLSALLLATVLALSPAPVSAEPSEHLGAPATSQVLTAGGTHTCVILTDASVRCFGASNLGQTGQGTVQASGDGPNEMGDALPPVDLGSGRTAVAVATGAGFSCALLDDDTVKCWGSANKGQLGQGDTTRRGDELGEMGDALPAIDLGGPVVAISAGGSSTCALRRDGDVVCFGDNENGTLGRGDTQPIGDGPGEMGDALVAVPLPGAVEAISVGSGFACALLNQGAVACWGLNSKGQLGLGDTENRGDDPDEMGSALPVVDIGGAAVAISAGQSHACAIRDDGSVVCWGGGIRGATGHGSQQSIGDGPGEMGTDLVPVDLGDGATARAVSAGGDRTCVLLSDHSLRCFGSNFDGALGVGDTNDRGDEPDEMGAALPAVDLGAGRILGVSTGSLHTCALLTKGTVKCWGTGGRLGLGDTARRGSSPAHMGRRLPGVDVGRSVGRPDVLLDVATTSPVKVAGSPVDLAVTVRNGGTSTLTGVVLTSSQAPGCDRTIAQIQPGDEVRFTCSRPTPGNASGSVRTVVSAATNQDATATTAVTSPVRVRTFRPDAAIRKGSGRFVGGDRYNTTGAKQSRRARVAAGGRARFTVRLQNDGNVEQRVSLRAPGSSSTYRVAYSVAGQDVTAAVRNGTFRTGRLDPGESESLTVVVTPRSSASPGDRIVLTLTATGSTGVRDVVKATAVRR